MALDETLIAAVRLIRPAIDCKIDGKPGDSIGWIADSEHVTIQRQRLARQGVDEQRLTIDGQGDMHETIRGNRTLVLQFTCETNSQTLDDTAEELADDLVAGLSREDVTALLWTELVGSPRCGDVRVVPYRDAHGDWRSAAIFEAVFPWKRDHVPASSVTVDRIGRVIGEGTADAHAVPFDVSEP